MIDLIHLPGYDEVKSWGQNSIFERYLEHEFEKSGNLDKYKNKIATEKLKEKLVRFKFLAGKDVTQLFEDKKGKKLKQYDLEVLESLGNEVHIDILSTNKDVFKRDERVKIDLWLKNTPTVYVKVFNFACDNYYWKTLSNVNTDVDLEGLLPEHQQQASFTHPW